MITVYGIPNCNTVKKAITWLNENKIDFQFHDYKKQGITKAMLSNWSKQVSIEVLLNKKGTTWKACSPDEQAAASNKAGAIQLMTEKPSLIKRPVVAQDGNVLAVGFAADNYSAIFGK